MGVSADEIERMRVSRQDIAPAPFKVYRPAWQSVMAFQALSTQWIVQAGLGGVFYQGIDYNAIPIVEKRMGVKRKARARVFSDIRVMESAARAVLNSA